LLEAAHYSFPVLGTQLRLATGATGFLECGRASAAQLLFPTIHRLAMGSDLASDLGFTHSLGKQSCRAKPPPFESIEISFHSGWISHAGNYITDSKICHYIL
jgi:hypothetical protein